LIPERLGAELRTARYRYMREHRKRQSVLAAIPGDYRVDIGSHLVEERRPGGAFELTGGGIIRCAGRMCRT
jgi:hypothetical protein